MSFLADVPSRANMARDDLQAALLAAVRDGEADLTWARIEIDGRGRSLSVLVSADAVKLDGVRINVTATTQQQMADAIGALLLTPKLADEIWKNAAVKISPTPQPISSTKAAMVGHSERVDRRIKGRIGLIADAGKDWVLSSHASAKRAANYGWHVTSNPWGGIRTERTVSLANTWVVQGVGTRHGLSHTDYSQCARFVLREGTLDGESIDVADLLGDPELAPLISAEGAKSTRQPGVPYSSGGVAQLVESIVDAGEPAAVPEPEPELEPEPEPIHVRRLTAPAAAVGVVLIGGAAWLLRGRT